MVSYCFGFANRLRYSLVVNALRFIVLANSGDAYVFDDTENDTELVFACVVCVGFSLRLCILLPISLLTIFSGNEENVLFLINNNPQCFYKD